MNINISEIVMLYREAFKCLEVLNAVFLVPLILKQSKFTKRRKH